MEKFSQEKQKEILAAAINLFAEKGFDRTTVDEIALKANVGKGTIYLYFENKEHIFFAIIEEGISKLHRMFEQITGKGDYLEQLKSLIFIHLKYVENNRELYGIFMKERLGMRLYEENALKKRFIDMHLTFHQSISKFMQTGIDQGFIRPIDPAYLGMAFIGMVSHFTFHWLFSNDTQPLTNLTETILSIFLNGVENHVNLNFAGGGSYVS